METAKIRRGNDIQLKIQLRLNNSDEFANIQSLRAVFVNSTLKDKLEKEYIKKNRFIGRFPIEPFTDEFEPTAYNVNSTGRHCYRVFVHNQYNGFGVYPDWKKSMPIRDVDYTNYYAEISRTRDTKTVVVTFPAEAQLFDGVYGLVVIAKIYDSGYKNNTRTITTNYNNLFELVGDSEDATDQKVQIEVTDAENTEPSGDIYVVSGTYAGSVDGKETIKLSRSDNSVVNIDVNSISGWYEEE